jgi:hypothetical protein
MRRNHPGVDSYIAAAAPFARPLLKRLRRLFRRACPLLEERLKWGFPCFEFRGMLGGFAAFKHHASFGFWRQDVLPDPHGLFKSGGPTGSGRLTDASQLPPDRVLLEYIRRAVALNEAGPPPRKRRRPKPPVPMPRDFRLALRKNRKALGNFEAFAPGQKREYLEWITEAKQSSTRERRLATAIGWIAEGKTRNWKYR